MSREFKNNRISSLSTMLSMNAAGKIPSVIFNEIFSLVIDSHISGNCWILPLHTPKSTSSSKLPCFCCAVLTLSFIGRVHFGARALLGLAISPAYISVGRREVFYSFKLFLPAFAALIGKGGGSAPLGSHRQIWQ